MDSIMQLCSAFSGTYAGRSMSDLAALYSEIEQKTSTFCTTYSIACAQGCGTCCEHFMPDITASEARLVGAYLLFIKKDFSLIEKVRQSIGNQEGPCPLYRFDSPFHCSVYPARPLICRLFGACAYQGKNGFAVFRRCKYNEEKTMPEHIDFHSEVPVMQDYSYLLRSLDDQEGEVGFLPEKVASMLDQLQFLAVMLDMDDTNPDDTPNPMAS
ncbi:MAG: YkgJ family cysteine cluster protein [Sphaerochaeta sp.]|jgi:Fe-S-cluster containining protein|uniref:YkgJ family cysteine cluster protein n=2 Tax=Sphaerochaeta TaxID=399320 RepID=UPI000AA6DFF1|nr:MULTISPECIES: YkgJ family cysteine cluster protein [unclassified Sphaerochaeta]MDX9823586.1 YkgJ family cysteine cluster protein [Sphaerochaeta sp.]MEA4864656.1 YkgJ family cysteine cluster protein [Sphaerochaeta sp.]HBO36189.1 YkgJ family cysteine cluster protein [Sphaerochaeta sp.]HCU30147.1 YkgJ family cysteine cluster protein [Sphaerochaeta sp.]HPE92532.1 YkgJ family cysteine cluster protein [Sphaerochaeta sp.]